MVIELYNTTVQRRGREPLKSLISVSKHVLKHLEQGWGCYAIWNAYYTFAEICKHGWRLPPQSSADQTNHPAYVVSRCSFSANVRKKMPGVRTFVLKEAKGEVGVKLGNENSVFCLWNILGRLFADSLAAAGSRVPVWDNFCDFRSVQTKRIHRYPFGKPASPAPKPLPTSTTQSAARISLHGQHI